MRLKFSLLIIAACPALLGFASKSPAKQFSFTINALPFVSARQKIVQKLGTPLKEFAPHYECGFFQDDPERHIKYYELQYTSVTWIGNEREKYQLEELQITPDSKYILTLNGKRISGKTTLKELMQLTNVHTYQTNLGRANPEAPLKARRKPNLTTISLDLQPASSDAKYICYFFRGKLCKIEFWSPC